MPQTFDTPLTPPTHASINSEQITQLANSIKYQFVEGIPKHLAKQFTKQFAQDNSNQLAQGSPNQPTKQLS